MDNMEIKHYYFPINMGDRIHNVSTHIDEITKEELDSELTPIIRRVFMLKPGNYGDPTIRQLFNWLADPHHSVEEFNYVLGPLVDIAQCGGHHPYLGLVAAEALAVRSPQLKGPWEHAAWFVLRLISPSKNINDYGAFSDNFKNWIILMIGDPDLCPSPNLWLEFFNIFDKLCGDAHYMAQAFKAVMFTCSDLNKFTALSDLNRFTAQCPYLIVRILEKFIEGGYLQTFDQQLSDKLLSQISDIQRIMMQDVTCSYALNPNRLTGSYELNIVIGIFKHVSELIQQDLEEIQKGGWNANEEASLKRALRTLKFLLRNFKKSCQTPQLLDVTASCIMDVVELVILVNIALLTDWHQVYHIYDPEYGIVYNPNYGPEYDPYYGPEYDPYYGPENAPGYGPEYGPEYGPAHGPEHVPEYGPGSLKSTDKLLGELCDKNSGLSVATSPVGQAVNCRYQGRLSNLRKQLGNLNIDCYVMICSLLYHSPVEVRRNVV